MVTPTRKHKYEDVSEMTVCNSAMVHGVFIGEVSSVKYSQTKTDVRFCEGKLSLNNIKQQLQNSW